jgi:formyltetrahydrofolate deformylase
LAWLARRLDEDKPDLIVLARYMRILPPSLVKKYPQRIVGIHPTLEPHFSGERPYQAAFESGVRLHGCTAHFVTEQLDEGPIIAQEVFPIDVGRDGVEKIREKALNLEAQTLSRAVQKVLAGQISVQDGKCVYTDIFPA